MDLSKLNFERCEDYHFSNVEMEGHKPFVLRSALAPIRDNSLPFVTLGVDPGRNIGIAYIHRAFVQIWWGKAPDLAVSPVYEGKCMSPGHLYGMWVQDMIETLITTENLLAQSVVVEGPAFSSKYGEANLAYIRMGIITGLVNSYVNLKFPAAVFVKTPGQIRKIAFGSGKADGSDQVPGVNKNAVAALGCAIAAASDDFEEDRRISVNLWDWVMSR